jgi:signal transduction histidine kinase
MALYRTFRIYGAATGLAATFWLAESVLHAYMFGEETLSHSLLGLDSNELWMRLVIVGLIYALAFGVHRSLGNRARMIEGLRACQKHLEDEVQSRSQALKENSSELARLAERERLARELHDTVSQSLFSAGLLADSASRLLDVNPEEARRQLEQIRHTIRGSLAELRILLLELRPSTIADGELGDLLRQMALSIGERDQIIVEAEIRSHCDPPPDRKVALYRIAQESLNNALKHAAARRICIRLTESNGGFTLQVDDDGTGFDPEDMPMGSAIGLEVMRERAQSAGLALSIISRLNGGTQVRATWTEKKEAA